MVYQVTRLYRHLLLGVVGIQVDGYLVRPQTPTLAIYMVAGYSDYRSGILSILSKQSAVILLQIGNQRSCKKS